MSAYKLKYKKKFVILCIKKCITKLYGDNLYEKALHIALKKQEKQAFIYIRVYELCYLIYYYYYNTSQHYIQLSIYVVEYHFFTMYMYINIICVILSLKTCESGSPNLKFVNFSRHRGNRFSMIIHHFDCIYTNIFLYY